MHTPDGPVEEDQRGARFGDDVNPVLELAVAEQAEQPADLSGAAAIQRQGQYAYPGEKQ